MRQFATALLVIVIMAGCGGRAMETPTPETGLTVRVFNSALAEVEVSAIWGNSRIPIRIGTVERETEVDLVFPFRSGELRMSVKSLLDPIAGVSNPVSVTTSDRGSVVQFNIDRRRRELELFEPRRDGS